jgi:hypothetical protein
MSRVVVEFEDRPDGSVKIAATPDVKSIIDLKKRGAGLTAAQAYAIAALNRCLELSRASEPGRIILPPGLVS